MASNNPDLDQLQQVFQTVSLSDDVKRCDQSTIIGVCLIMCPEEEIEIRRKQFLVHPMEATAATASLGQRMRNPDRSKMVKCYSRPAAGKEISRPEILRPFPVLKRTISYLLHLTTRSDRPWEQVYDFINDRLRSVRQDMIIQELGSRETMALLGPMLKFYFYSKYRCDIQERSTYDAHLHASQMEECVDRLLVAYSENGHDEETEYLRLILLHRFKSRALWSRILLTPIFDRHKNYCVNVVRLGQFYRQGNFYGFFRIFKKMTISEQIAVSAGVDLTEFRRRSLLTMKKAYARSKVPLDKIAKWLDFRNLDDAKVCLVECGFQINDDGLIDFTSCEEHIGGKTGSVSFPWWRWPDSEMNNYHCL